MKPICQFCGNEIRTTHYGITRKGSICVECLRRMKNEIRHINISTDFSSKENSARDRDIEEVS